MLGDERVEFQENEDSQDKPHKCAKLAFWKYDRDLYQGWFKAKSHDFELPKKGATNKGDINGLEVEDVDEEPETI